MNNKFDLNLLSEKNAWVTVLSSKDYLIAVLALYEGLKKCGTSYPMVVACTPHVASDEAITHCLQKASCIVEVIPETRRMSDPRNKDPNYQLNNNERTYYTESKSGLMTLNSYDKLVFIDCDTYVYNNMDWLFEYPSGSILGGDVPQPTFVRSGFDSLFVFSPRYYDYSILKFLVEHDNQTCNLYSELFTAARFDEKYQLPKERCKACYTHYIGKMKPWLMQTIDDRDQLLIKDNVDDYLQLLSECAQQYMADIPEITTRSQIMTDEDIRENWAYVTTISRHINVPIQNQIDSAIELNEALQQVYSNYPFYIVLDADIGTAKYLEYCGIRITSSINNVHAQRICYIDTRLLPICNFDNLFTLGNVQYISKDSSGKDITLLKVMCKDCDSPYRNLPTEYINCIWSKQYLISKHVDTEKDLERFWTPCHLLFFDIFNKSMSNYLTGEAPDGASRDSDEFCWHTMRYSLRMLSNEMRQNYRTLIQKLKDVYKL